MSISIQSIPKSKIRTSLSNPFVATGELKLYIAFLCKQQESLAIAKMTARCALYIPISYSP